MAYLRSQVEYDAAIEAGGRSSPALQAAGKLLAFREVQFLSWNSTPSRPWLCSEPRASASAVLPAPNLSVTELV